MLRYVIPLLVALPATAQDAVLAGNPLPQRIVSMNLCTDQLLLLLVAPQRIASLSYFASDPAFSWLAPKAQGIPANRGQAEEVLAFEPDLILTSEFSATLAANLLERLGHPVQRLGFAASTEDVYAQIRAVAAWTGDAEQAETLVADMAAAIEREREVLLPRLQGKSAAFFAGNGFSYGAGSLQHDFLTSLGLRNVAAEAGLQGPAQLPIEVLIAAQPDFLFTDAPKALDAQLAQPLLRHPALAALGDDTRVLQLSEALFQCAGPQLAEAYRALSAQLAAGAQ